MNETRSHIRLSFTLGFLVVGDTRKRKNEMNYNEMRHEWNEEGNEA